jgi:hypothetical protein
MKSRTLVAVVLLLAAAPALAQQEISPVQVRPDAEYALEFACAAPTRANPADVERILAINDRTQTHELSHKLLGAVVEACSQGVSDIVVSRAASGRSVTWAPAARGAMNSIALR